MIVFRSEATLTHGPTSDEKRGFFTPFVTTRGAHGDRRPRDHRRVPDGALDRPNRRSMARFARVFRQMVLRLSPVSPMDALRALGSAARGVERHQRGRGDGSDDRKHRRPGAPLRHRRKGGSETGSRALARWAFDQNHLRTNGIGLPVAVDITPGPTSDETDAVPLLEADGPEPKVLLADRSYDYDHVRDERKVRGVTPMILTRRNRKIQIPVVDPFYALRNRIERCFNRWKNSRRLAIRNDQPAESHLGFVRIAAVGLWTKAFGTRT